MPEVSYNQPYTTHGFFFECEGVQIPVTKVTGLNEGMTETIEVIDGGSPHARKMASGIVKFDTLVIERNMDGSEFDQKFQDWFGEMFQLDGSSGGSSVRRSGAIVILENGNEVLRFLFFEGWVKSSKFADLEAGSANTFKQTVELEHDGLKRVLP